jgi:hypothetical protein
MLWRSLLAIVLLAFVPCFGDEVDFRTDVMAVLSKAGCNLGACHGNGQGKGGFRISLRGQDPEEDWSAIVREQGGRRVNFFEPEQSLIYLKATAAIPHEGGRRFDSDSIEGQIFLKWLKSGAVDSPASLMPSELVVSPDNAVIKEPTKRVKIRALAKFPDGRLEDVSAVSVYESSNLIVKISPDGGVEALKFGEVTVSVRYLGLQKAVSLAFIPARQGFNWSAPAEANLIDHHVFEKLRKMQVNPSPVCDDATFVRRLYLDLLGVIPSADTARAFIADGSVGKRERLIDSLLKREEFNDFWALKWADLLRIEERQLDANGVKLFHAWIRESVALNKPIDQFARELLSAKGSTYKNPPANWWRANRDPVSRAENTARVFLGSQINCAQCHNHPFERWTQADYYDWTAVFRRIDYKIVKNDRGDSNDKQEFRGEQIVNLSGNARIENPRTGKQAKMRFLGGGAPVPTAAKDELDLLSEWLSKSPQFSRMQVNRIWANLLGRGIVDPADDFRTSNPPSHPALLDSLATEFSKSGYDLRSLIRLIVSSKTYQLDSLPNETNADDDANAARAVVRRLGAEQILDSAAKALSSSLEIPGYSNLSRLSQVPAGRKHYRPLNSDWDFFQLAFGKPPRLVATDCERTNEPTVVQAFQLISGSVLRDLLSRSTAAEKWSNSTPEDAVEAMFWSILNRAPTVAERGAFLTHINGGDRRKMVEDSAWALLNSKEFLFRH